MAEFQEVMKQKGRMCTELNCNGCPIDSYFDSCVQITPQNAAKYEELVMKWTSAHPEPQYPTWKEWQKETFPDAEFIVCPKHFMCNKELKCLNQTCYQCTDTPIPVEIAKKLGIKPKGKQE